MCSANYLWILSPCQGNGILNIMETNVPFNTARGKGIVVNSMGHFPVPCQCQGAQTLIHGHQEIYCMHNILAKVMNTNCSFYNEQTNEMNAQYTANICTVLAPEMDYI